MRHFLSICFCTVAIVAGVAAQPNWELHDPHFTSDDLSPRDIQLAPSVQSSNIASGGQALVPDDPTAPEIESLADALFKDPLLIYQYVRNNVAYEHYYGSKKGAVLTLLERSGNDYDQCALLVALLKAAGLSPSYVRGIQLIPYETARIWLGLDANPSPNLTWAQVLANWGLSSTLYGATGWTETQKKQILAAAQFSAFRGWTSATSSVNISRQLLLERLWVSVTVDGTLYVLDPSYKPQMASTPVDYGTAMGYSRTAFLTAAGGTTPDTYRVSAIDEAAMGSYLSDRTNQLIETIKSSSNPHRSVDELLGRRLIVADNGAAMPTSAAFTVNGSTSTLTQIEDAKRAKLVIQFNPTSGGTAVTRYLSDLAGKRLSLSFLDNTATVYLDDEELTSTSVTGTTVSLRTALSYAGGYANMDGTLNYKKGNLSAYALVYGFSPNGQQVRMRQRILDGYLREAKAAGTGTYGSDGNLVLNSIPDAGLRRRILAETLNVLGLSWFHYSRLAGLMVSDIQGVDALFSQGFGRAAQEQNSDGSTAGYYVDLPFVGSLAVSRSGLKDQRENFFRNFAFFSSAFEHAIVEQQQPGSAPAAVSTIRVIQLANRATADTTRDELFLVNASTINAVRPLLRNYSSSFLDQMQTAVSNGSRYFLPENALNTLNQWTGTGYIQDQGSVGMIITGGLAGGFSSTTTPLSSSLIANFSAAPSFYTDSAASTGLSSSAPSFNTITNFGLDPVDMGSGAFTLDATDLTLGEAAPRGLTLARSYNSNRRDSDPVGLGWGWTHNYDLRATVRSAPEAMLGETTPFDAAMMVVAAYATIDVFSSATTAKDWAVSTLAAGWAVDQTRNNAVAIALGGNSLQFIKQPGGSYQAPAKSTLSLTLETTTGDYLLTERLGSTFRFSAAQGGRGTKIADIDGKEMTLTYSSNRLSTVTDAHARSLTFNYTSSRLSSVTDNSTPQRTISYLADDGNGNLTGCTDPESKTWSYTYTDRRISETRDPQDRIVVQNDYDSDGRVVKQRNQGLVAREFTLSWSGFRNTEVTPLGQRTAYLYDVHNRPVGRIDGEGNRSATVYDGQDQVVQAITPRGNSTYFSFDRYFNLVKVTDPLGAKTVYTYDSLQRRTKIELIDPNYPDPSNPDGDVVDRSSSFEYNAGNNSPRPDATVDPRGGRTEFVYKTSSDAAAGKPETVTRKSVDGDRTTTFHYDTRGLPSSVDTPKRGGGVETESFVYNFRGDLTSHTDRRGTTSISTYNARRQPLTVTGPSEAPDYASPVTRWFYDASGNLMMQVDPTGRASRTTTSATGKSITTESGLYNNDSASPGLVAGDIIATSTNTYDVRDWIDYTDGPTTGQRTDYTPDNAGRIHRVTDPLSRYRDTSYNADGQQSGTADLLNAATGRTTGQLYDNRGQPTVATDGRGNNITSAFDAWGERLSLVNRRGKTWRFTYYENGASKEIISPLLKTSTRTYNDRNLLKTLKKASTASTALVYDGADRVQTSTDTVGAITYTYNANGQPETIVEGAATLTRVYDVYGRIKTYTDGRNNIILYHYYANGLVKSVTYPGTPARTVNYGYDNHNRLHMVTDWDSRVTTLDYRDDGLLRKITRPNLSTRELFYDLAGQLLKVEERDPSGFLHSFFKMTYDLGGRVESRYELPVSTGGASGALSAMTYDDDNRLLTWSGQSVVHDDDGNMTTGPLPATAALGSYVYNSRNQLTSAGGLSYTYDAEGNRVSLTANGQTARYVIDPHGGSLPRVLVRERPSGGSVLSVHAGGLLIYDFEVDTGNITYYHYDQIGNTIALSNGSGAVTDRIEYTPYGTIRSRTGASETPFLFGGALGVMTDANGLCYMRARYYNPLVGRFCNADPIGFQAGLNLFTFVSGNPISRTDPSGLDPDLFNYSGPGYLPPLMNYGQPASTGQFISQVAGSYVNSATQIGSVIKDAATFGGSAEKVQLFSAMISPVTKALPIVASGEGLGISVFEVGGMLANPGTATVADLLLHSASLATNGYTFFTLGGGLASDLTDGSMPGQMIDLVMSGYTPPELGGHFASGSTVVTSLLGAAERSSAGSSGGKH